MSQLLAPYEAPKISSRGWRVGPTALLMNLAANADSYGDNLLLDPGFVTDLSHWTPAVGVWDGTEGRAGLGSILFDSSTLGAGNFRSFGGVGFLGGFPYVLPFELGAVDVWVPVVAGQKISASAWVTYIGFVGSAMLVVQRVNASHTYIGDEVLEQVDEASPAASPWQRVAADGYVIPDDGTAYVRFAVAVTFPSGSAGRVWFDDAALRSSYGPTSGVCRGLAADVRVDVAVTMDLAAATGDGLDADLLFSSAANFTMMPAAADCDALSATASVDLPVTMNLADGSGGAALVPALSVVVPITFGALGAGGFGLVNPGNIHLSWTHTRLAADNCAVVALCGQSADDLASLARSVSYGGFAMTSLGSVKVFDAGASMWVWVEWFYSLSPTSGAQTVVADVLGGSSGFTQVGANSLSYSNVGSVGNFGSQTGSTALMSHTVTSAVNRVVVRAASCYQTISGGNQTVRDSDSTHYIQDAPGAASVMFNAATFAGTVWSSAALQLT